MNTLNTLSTLMSEKVRNNSFEEVQLTDSNSLRTIVKCMVAGQMNSDQEIERTPKAIHEAMTEFAGIVKDQEQYGELLSAFQSLSDAFAIRVGDAYKELIKIKDTVTELVNKGTAIAKSRISEDPVLASTESDNFTYTKLKPVRWDMMDNISEPVLINKMCNSLGIEEVPTGSEKYIQDVLISRLPYASEKNQTEFKDVTVSKAKAKEMIDAVAAKVNGKVSREVVAITMAHIMSLDEYKCRKAVGAINRLKTGESADSINDMLRMVYTYNTVMPYMTKDVMGVAASTQDAIEGRKAAMQSFIDMTAYLCSYYRNTVWRDSVVVPGMKINTDNWRAFASADRQIIKNNPHLAIMQYKNKIYGDENIPVYGIKGETIINSCDQIAKEAYAEASANTLACNRRKKEIFRDSFIVTAGQWLRSQKKYSLEYLYTHEPERFAASIYDSNRDDAVENMFYTVILNSCYVNTLTAKLHNRLRDEYKKVMLGAESLNERDVINADTKVLADVINEFLVDLVLV